MPEAHRGAQRASTRRIPTLPIVILVAAVIGAGALGASPQRVGAATTTTAVPTPSPTPLPSPSVALPATSSPSPEPSLAGPGSASPAPSPTTPDGSALEAGTPSSPVAQPAARHAAKVVVVVGPVGANTRRYIAKARAVAAQARSYGARVIELYSPNATWTRVRAAASGANVLVYLGHGNGWPSSHGPFDPAGHDGLGLNRSAGAGNSNTDYYGESIIARSLDLAPDAVVILNHLCYASGNNEWGRGNPVRATAIARVDNFGAGFLRAGAAAVIADGLGSPDYVLRGLLRTDRTIRQIFWSAGDASRSRVISFASRRTPGARALMDPYAPGRYYRSVIGDLDFRATGWR